MWGMAVQQPVRTWGLGISENKPKPAASPSSEPALDREVSGICKAPHERNNSAVNWCQLAVQNDVVP